MIEMMLIIVNVFIDIQEYTYDELKKMVKCVEEAENKKINY